MFKLLIRLFLNQGTKQRPKTKPSQKQFRFLELQDKSQAPSNVWYRLKKWQSPNFLLIETSYSKEWKIFNARTSLNGEEIVMGMSMDNRTNEFLDIADQPDFKVSLEREGDNPVDPNAIKVIGTATVNGNMKKVHLGYIEKEKAQMLKDESDFEARPYSVYLPYNGKPLRFTIRVLIRSNKYRKARLENKVGE